MIQFPSLNESDFIKTRRRIHSVAKVIGKFRETLVKPIAKNDNLYLKIVDKGFCTPAMPEYNELEIGCNLETLKVEVANSKDYDAIDLPGKTQKLLSDELKSILSKYGVSPELDDSNFDSAKAFDVSENNVKDFLEQFANYNELFTAFHKKINVGVKTQICLWPHHFDNAFKWFSGKKINEEDEYMGIGVSNGDEMYELPYIYFTLYPPLRKTNTLEIAEGAFLHDTDWTGLVLPYDAIMEKNDADSQAEFVNNFLDISFKSIQRGFTKR